MEVNQTSNVSFNRLYVPKGYANKEFLKAKEYIKARAEHVNFWVWSKKDSVDGAEKFFVLAKDFSGDYFSRKKANHKVHKLKKAIDMAYAEIINKKNRFESEDDFYEDFFEKDLEDSWLSDFINLSKKFKK